MIPYFTIFETDITGEGITLAYNIDKMHGVRVFRRVITSICLYVGHRDLPLQMF